MGSWLAKSADASVETVSPNVSHSDVAYPEEPICSTIPTSTPIPEALRTREGLLAKYGPPTLITGPSDGFLSTCYQEDCLLMGGLRNNFTERMVWEIEGNQDVAYLNGDRVLKIFRNSYV